MSTLPTVITASGLQPIPPETLRSQLVNAVAEVRPGYTSTLPGSLIEDIASTDVFAIAQMDQFRIDLVNSLTPFGANPFLLNALGQIYGVDVGQAANTSVFVQFSGTPGFVIAKGFRLSDGSHQYIVQDGGIIGADGDSGLIYCLAANTGIWAVPAGTVTQLITSVPTEITLTVDNPETGIPGTGEETQESYRARVLQAGLAASQGMSRYLKTLLGRVPGVQPRLVSVVQQASGWSIIVGGGDPYQVAYAIFRSVFDLPDLVGSEIGVTGFTEANPGVVTTDLNHGYTTGDEVTITGCDPAGFDDTYTVTVTGLKTFSVGVDTTGFGTYVGGGVCTPNTRNIVVTVIDHPDEYQIPYISPPQQVVEMVVTWNTTSPNVVSESAMAQLAVPALVEYVNAIPAGKAMNLFVLESVFQDAVASVLPPDLLTRMIFAVSIDGVGVSPDAGTGIIAGDPQSFLFAVEAGIVVARG